MTYAQEISALRLQVGDRGQRVHAEWTGNGVDTFFQMPLLTFPVLEGSYTVKLAGVPQTETTHYTLDRETGLITMVTPPGSNVVLTIDNTWVHLTDAAWFQILNDVIRSLGDDFWSEIVDDTTFSAVAAMLSLAMGTGYIAVYDVAARTSTTQEWERISARGNWRYARDENKLYFGSRDMFGVTGEALRVRGLKTYTIGTATSDTFPVQDRYLTIIKYGSIAQYSEYRMKENTESIGKITQEATRTPLQEMIMVIDRNKRWYEEEKAKLKPMKPSYSVPIFNQGKFNP